MHEAGLLGSTIGREISNQRSLDDLRKFLCEKMLFGNYTDTFIKRIVTCLKNWVLIHETPLSSTFSPSRSVLKHFSVWTQLERNFLAELLQEKLDTTAETIINENLNNFTWSYDVKHRELEKWSESLKEDKCFLPQKLLKALNFILKREVQIVPATNSQPDQRKGQVGGPAKFFSISKGGLVAVDKTPLKSNNEQSITKPLEGISVNPDSTKKQQAATTVVTDQIV